MMLQWTVTPQLAAGFTGGRAGPVQAEVGSEGVRPKLALPGVAALTNAPQFVELRSASMKPIG